MTWNFFSFDISLYYYMVWNTTLTALSSPISISGAIQPSVPAAPDLRENDLRPAASFLHSPKSDIIALICPCALGWEMSTLCGLMSRWTNEEKKNIQAMNCWTICLFLFLFKKERTPCITKRLMDWSKRRYETLPIMHCFQWVILYRWSCGATVTKHLD